LLYTRLASASHLHTENELLQQRTFILHITPKNSNTIAEFKNRAMADEFFVHPTAIIDEDVTIGEGTSYLAFLSFDETL
jgi:hypothetical protein